MKKLSQKQKQKQLLYKDKYVQISQKAVKVIQFYFPQDSKNQILFKDINKLQIKEMNQIDQTLGVDPQFFKNFNKKVDSNKNMYIQMAVQDQSVRLSFAPQDPMKAFKLIQKKWQENKIQSQKQAIKPLQQKNLNENVNKQNQQINKPKQKIKQNSKSINKNDYKQNQDQNMKKRNSPDQKLSQGNVGQIPKKKVKQTQKQEQAEQPFYS